MKKAWTLFSLHQIWVNRRALSSLLSWYSNWHERKKVTLLKIMLWCIVEVIVYGLQSRWLGNIIPFTLCLFFKRKSIGYRDTDALTSTHTYTHTHTYAHTHTHTHIYIYICVCVCIYRPFRHEVYVTQGTFLSRGLRFEFRVFILLDLLPYQD